jgi:hypothetical protein
VKNPPAGIRILGGGLSTATADGRYVRRFVDVAGVPTLAGNTRSQLNAAAVTEVVLENPNGPVQSLVPANALAVAFLENGDGARFGNRVKIARIGVSPVVSGIRGEGTYAAPTPPLTGVDIFLVQARPVTDTGGAGTSAVVSSIAFRSRENLGAAAWGSSIRFSAGRVGAAIQDVIVDMQSGGAGVAELVSAVATLRLVPGGSAYVIRDSANTFDAHSWNAGGTSVVLVASPTTADLSIGSGTGSGNTNVNVRGAAGTSRGINFTTASVLRWQVRASTAAESGANAGSAYEIVSRDDAGALIDIPFQITRAANGAITLGGAGNRQVIIAGTAWGAGAASLRFNGLTNGAGAAAGTLLNAPAAGDPAFWLPVSIAGTVRFIPCW